MNEELEKIEEVKGLFDKEDMQEIRSHGIKSFLEIMKEHKIPPSYTDQSVEDRKKGWDSKLHYPYYGSFKPDHTGGIPIEGPVVEVDKEIRNRMADLYSKAIDKDLLKTLIYESDPNMISKILGA